MLSVTFAGLSLINLGPASLGLFNSMMAGKKKRMTIIVIAIAEEMKSVFGI